MDDVTPTTCTVLAAVGDDETAPLVLRAATAMARLLGCVPRGVHVTRDRLPGRLEPTVASSGIAVRTVAGAVVPTLHDLLEQPLVRLGVLASRTRTAPGHVLGGTAGALVSGVSTPLLLVSPTTDRRHLDEPTRVLLPLDGEGRDGGVFEALVDQLRAADLDVLVQHVVVPSSPLPCLDQLHHALPSWEREFLARSADVDDALLLDRGDAADRIVELVRADDVDLVLLGWSQDLSAGRAPVVRRVLERCSTPVVLVPVTGARVTSAVSRPAPRR